jgi:excisionase family DNA binding protein
MNDKFMTYAEVIKFLKLSRTTIDRYIRKKAIPNYKVGRLRLFDREELVEWVKSHRDGQAESHRIIAKKQRKEK